MDAALNAAASLAIAKYLSKLPTDIFPISASIFYSSYVLLCQPAKHTLDVKKSTYKKLAKFLRALEKDRLIQIKGINEDIKVIGVDGRHPKVVERELQ